MHTFKYHVIQILKRRYIIKKPLIVPFIIILALSTACVTYQKKDLHPIVGTWNMIATGCDKAGENCKYKKEIPLAYTADGKIYILKKQYADYTITDNYFTIHEKGVKKAKVYFHISGKTMITCDVKAKSCEKLIKIK